MEVNCASKAFSGLYPNQDPGKQHLKTVFPLPDTSHDKLDLKRKVSPAHGHGIRQSQRTNWRGTGQAPSRGIHPSPGSISSNVVPLPHGLSIPIRKRSLYCPLSRVFTNTHSVGKRTARYNLTEPDSQLSGIIQI